MPRVSAPVLNALMESARAVGLDTDNLLPAAGLTPSQLRDRELRVDCGVAFDLMEAAARASGDPHFGLTSANKLQPETAGVLGHLALCAGSPREAIEAYCRFQRLMGDGLLLTLSDQGDQTVLTLQPHPELTRPAPRHTIENLLAGLWQMAGRLGLRGPPSWVSFRHGSAPPEDAYRAAFGAAPVYFNQTADALACPTAAMCRPTHSSDPALFQYLEARAQALTERITAGGPFAHQVSRELVRQLRVQRPTAARVAEALSISVRSLQRRLAAEGSSFQQLLDGARCELAKHHLATSPGPVGEIGFLLGFTEESAFRKAFRRWTGTSPTAYRSTTARFTEPD